MPLVQAPLEQVLAAIRRRWGPDALRPRGELSTQQTPLPTGITPLDGLVGRWPRGRLSLVTGRLTAGLTTLGLHALAAAQREDRPALIIDVGCALDPVSAVHCGVDLEQMLLVHPAPGTLGMDIARDVVEMDWGTAEVELGGQRVTVKQFTLRWCYSRKLFVAAYPSEKQECFLDGHVQAFHYFGGLPQRITYDNLKPAVLRILEGRNREEQARFLAFRNHYVFDSRYCTPAAGHEKGGVENDVGYARRNFLAGCPSFADFAALNAYLLDQCQQADERTVYGQPQSVAAAWEIEREVVRPLPPHDVTCCAPHELKVNRYSQVQFETNRYSVPTDQAFRTVTLRAFLFHVDILHQDQVLARHARSYAREQDILDPLHYLPLLEQRPGAFEHARPMRQLRQTWDPVYDRLLAHLQARLAGTRAIREFVRILSLHRTFPPDAVTAAVKQALGCGCAHLDNVTLCLHQALTPDYLPPQLDLSSQPSLAHVGQQPVDLRLYDQLLRGGSDGD